jgi:hypothetical protein
MSNRRIHRADHAKYTYRPSGWLVNAAVLDHGLETPAAFFRNPYLNTLEDRLRATMMFQWIRGDFGPVDTPTVAQEQIESVWMSLIDHAFFGRHGSVMTFYVEREVEFWNNLFK